ncbi:hypothetical protein QF035_009135 [Streptomyces umbrinus]|uniref:Uncharacterized protein n=1 Tax=Streptomyces umbrinus TaxID=67370 RepID=A0ABU0T795_9ACTN|nr:hypothetical protein [Streptomyces umbrinus]
MALFHEIGKPKRVGVQCDGGQRRPLGAEAADEFGGQVLGFGRRAAVARDQQLAACGQSFGEETAPSWLRPVSSRGNAAMSALKSPAADSVLTNDQKAVALDVRTTPPLRSAMAIRAFCASLSFGAASSIARM